MRNSKRYFFITLKSFIVSIVYISTLLTLSSCLDERDSYRLIASREADLSEDKHQISFEFILDPGTLRLAQQGLALGLTIQSTESHLIWDTLWMDYLLSFDETEPTLVTLKGLSPLQIPNGPFTVNAYFKSGRFNLDDHEDSPEPALCAKPLSLRSSLHRGAIDLGLGAWQGRIHRDQVITIPIHSQTCGPGDTKTSLSGEILIPSSLSSAAFNRLMLHLDPIEPERFPPFSTPLSFYLNTTPVRDQLTFFINHLPEGTYRLSVFVDSDGDALPTPCSLTLGRGGDRWMNTPRESVITLTRGEAYLLEDPLSVEIVSECEGLTLPLFMGTGDFEEQEQNSAIFLGQLQLDEETLTAIALSPTQQVWFSFRQRGLPPLRYISAQPLFSLRQALLSDGRFALHLPFQATFEPQAFSLWLDEGADQILTPCDDPISRGGDVWWWSGDTSRLSPLLEPDLSRPPPLLPINLTKRCAAPTSIAELTFDLNFAWPDQVGTRPLILVTENLETGEIEESVLLDLNAQTLERSITLQRRFESGTYLLSAYIDQNLDRRFTLCSDRDLGDRISTNEGVSFSIRPGETAYPTLSLTPRECPALESSLDLNLELDSMMTSWSSDLIGTQSLEDCEAGELLVEIYERDLLKGIKEMGDVQVQLCIQPHLLDNLTSLPAGMYQVTVCGVIAEELLADVRAQTLERDCFSPNIWVAQQDIVLTQLPTHEAQLTISPQCVCPITPIIE